MSVTSMCGRGSSANDQAVTSDPTGSPMMARLMLPGLRRLKTTIGSLLSMHSEIAVVSITFRPCSSTFR